jgi:hypothetical protein
MPAFLRAPALLLIFLAMSCSSSGSPDTAPAPDSGDQARVRIENRASLDMDIYVLRHDQRIRLGFVPGGETATFALPGTLTTGSGSVQFEARPVRSSGEPIVSEPFRVARGEEIAWSVSPQ